MVSAAPLPNRPARLGEDDAAAFLSISKTTFRCRWQTGEYPRPIREGGRLFWSRLQLERFVAAQFGINGDGQEDSSWADLS
jgi:hypothetical protein